MPGYPVEWELQEPFFKEEVGGLAVLAGMPTPLLMEAFGHQTQRQMMAYMEIQAMEVVQIFEMEL